ncbi:MAG TPA: hypothetical protein VNC50_14860, partial [Planctomycetia bacterium]|nr:hypothetical protein [Planctomycetia bacterium]
MIAGFLLALLAAPPPPSFPPTEAERAELEAAVSKAESDKGLMAKPERAVFVKAARWALHYPEEWYAKNWIAKVRRVLAAAGHENGAPATPAGWIATGHWSDIDDSVQPYALY